MADELAQQIERFYARMERQLRGLKDAGEDDELRETLDTLHKSIMALMTRFEPPPELPAPMGMVMPSPSGLKFRTVGSNY